MGALFIINYDALPGRQRTPLIPPYTYSEMIKLSPNYIRRLIPHYMPSQRNPDKLGEIVDDIIYKVRHQVCGTHRYVRHNAGRIKDEIYGSDCILP